MESEVRRLFLEYGVKNVMSCVNTVSKALYDELVDIYGEKECIVETAEAIEPSEAPPAEKKLRRLRIVKKKEDVEAPAEISVEAPVEPSVEPPAESVVTDEKPGDKVVEVVTLRVKKKVATPVEVQQSAEESDSESDATIPVDVPATYRIKTPDEIKKERLDHRDAVEKKRLELIQKGIKPESLLTRENLENWLNAGLSYQRIAKELTGCHETVVSATAKMFGLKSKIGKIIMLKNMNMKLQHGL
jgi:hypothetical protein